ncbi:hypothetical protein QL285_084841 [Trifolium repens]|nr:hypothetical protein QL285_084841 [Trifolium repens]
MDTRHNTDTVTNISSNEKIEVIQCYGPTCVNVRHPSDTKHAFNLKCRCCIAFRQGRCGEGAKSPHLQGCYRIVEQFFEV